ncbi:hypothetical protein SAMD00079811_73680 [Scytonema sp. HK-05]|nr:hypothetical protein SAMD00079811_73680 [Scytonema sp. HK-05]
MILASSGQKPHIAVTDDNAGFASFNTRYSVWCGASFGSS